MSLAAPHSLQLTARCCIHRKRSDAVTGSKLVPTTEAATGMLLAHWEKDRLCQLKCDKLLQILQKLNTRENSYAKAIEFRLPREQVRFGYLSSYSFMCDWVQVPQAADLPVKGKCVLWAQVTRSGRVAIVGQLSKKYIKLQMSSSHLHASIDSIEASKV